jgi:hypothetical protein
MAELFRTSILSVLRRLPLVDPASEYLEAAARRKIGTLDGMVGLKGGFVYDDIHSQR